MTQNCITRHCSLTVMCIDISDLKCLESVPQVEVLSLQGNPVCELLGDTLEKQLSQVLLQLKECNGRKTVVE